MYYLILPFALQQGEAAFINQKISIAGKNILSPYATIFTDVLFCLIAVIAFSLMKARFKRIPWLGSALISILFIYFFAVWLTSFLGYADFSEVFLTGRQMLYIPLSYFLWLAIFQAVTREQYEQFLKLMFYVTPVSTILYILNSSKVLPLFDDSLMYMEVDFGSESFVRDFRTIPIWLITCLVLAIQSLLTKTIKINKSLVILNLLILPIGILFTFTRSILVVVVMEATVMFLLYGLKMGGKFVLNLIFLAFFLTISVIVIQKVFPNQSGYFEERLTDAKSEGKNEQNVNLRVEFLEEASRIADETSTFFGAGMNRQYWGRMEQIGSWRSDSSIPLILVHSGWIGVFLVFGTMLLFFVDSFIYFMKTRDWLVIYLGAQFMVFFIGSLLMGGGSLDGNVWTFMNFALYTVVRFNKWRDDNPELLYSTPKWNKVRHRSII